MRSFLFAAVISLAAVPAFASGPGGQTYTEKKYFSVVIPSGWARHDAALGLSAEEKKVYGAEFLGPASGELSSSISVHYYAPGNLVQKTYRKFIKLHSKPALGANPDGNVYGEVKDGKAGNYYAKVFERRIFEYFPKNSMNPKKMDIYESYAVVPAKKGFFVLRYYSPLDIAKANKQAYESVLASFKPLLP